MNKLLALFLPLLCLTSCGPKESNSTNPNSTNTNSVDDSLNTYFKVIEKLKTYDGEIVINTHYSNGYYYEEGFFKSDGDVVLYTAGTRNEFSDCTYLCLPNSTQTPNVYKCAYMWKGNTSESAVFYILNSYTSSDDIAFDSYNGSEATLQSNINVAKASVNLIIISFNNWLVKEYSTDLSKIGMFPNFK